MEYLGISILKFEKTRWVKNDKFRNCELKVERCKLEEFLYSIIKKIK